MRTLRGDILATAAMRFWPLFCFGRCRELLLTKIGTVTGGGFGGP